MADNRRTREELDRLGIGASRVLTRAKLKMTAWDHWAELGVRKAYKVDCNKVARRRLRRKYRARTKRRCKHISEHGRRVGGYYRGIGTVDP